MKTFLYLLSLVVSLAIIVLSVTFHSQLASFRSWGIGGIFLINLIGSLSFLPAPAIATVVAGGGLYPPFLVALTAALGAAVGDSVGYFLGNSGKHLVLRHQEKKWYVLLHKAFTRFGGILIFLFAFIPNPFFDVIGIVAGVSGYSFKKFFVILLLGRLVRDILLALFGAKL